MRAKVHVCSCALPVGTSSCQHLNQLIKRICLGGLAFVTKKPAATLNVGCPKLAAAIQVTHSSQGAIRSGSKHDRSHSTY